MKNRNTRLNKLWAAVATLAVAWAGHAHSDTLNVAVASNFIAAMESIEEAFESQSSHEIRLIRGSSGKHYAQIRSGAPFDVFLSADQLRPRRLVEEGSALPTSLGTYAQGQLALWSRQEGLMLDDKYLLDSNDYRTIAIANPRLAPYGQAAQEYFDYLQFDPRERGQLVLGENIAQTLQFAYSGNADLALVAYSQTLALTDQQAGSVWLVPAAAHEPIRQDMVLLSDTPAAWEFAAFMASKAVEALLLQHGYLLPEASP